MERTAVAIRHVGFEDLGAFAPAIQAAGYAIRYHDVGVDDWATLRRQGADLLVVLGGPVGACEDERYPFLRGEADLIRARLEANLPTMGICLGAQLIARAAGARVFPGPAKEIGFAPIALTEEGRLSCLSAFAEEPLTLHWHGDTFDLPAGAVRLASTETCANQAFAIGPNIIGFQFHPEAGGPGFERWLIGHTVELSAAGIDIAALRAEAQRHGAALARKARAVCAAWLRGLAP
ncbi:glutamine amidotransferase [Chelativorans intermedius]|uniref:Glutamine amidotransferase n=1 Tax=Chelativorans intermedius TaxID=515947 RepID=A0ABV6D5R1_9HYPH|nr:glutamine amidotransferase [Chelativorans intermedius]MCT8998895.1 glutamine amidotransferase [Chelativorans intermedius]